METDLGAFIQGDGVAISPPRHEARVDFASLVKQRAQEGRQRGGWGDSSYLLIKADQCRAVCAVPPPSMVLFSKQLVAVDRQRPGGSPHLVQAAAVPTSVVPLASASQHLTARHS